MIVRNRKKEKGWALITVMLISALMLSATGLVLSKMLVASKDVVRTDKINKIDAVSDVVVSNVLGWINNKSWDEANNRPAALNLNGVEFIEDLYKTNSSVDIISNNSNVKLSSTSSVVLSSSLMSYSKLDPNKSYYFKDFLNDKTKRASSFLSTGSLTQMEQKLSLDTLGLSLFSIPEQKWLLKDLSEKIYRKFNIEYGEKGNKVKAEARVSIIPISTNITGVSEDEMHKNGNLKDGNGNIIKFDSKYVPPHEDIYKMTTKVCVPDCNKPENTRRIEMIIRRPIVTRAPIPPYGVYADGSINLQNKQTSSASAFNLTDTHEGDVHSNTDVIIGATGNVGGKVTSAGVVNVNGNIIPDTGIPATGHALSTTSQVYNKSESKSHVDPVPKPDWDFKPYPNSECTPQIVNDPVTKTDKIVFIGPCRVTGDFPPKSLPNNIKNIEFQDKIYITGDMAVDSFSATGSKAVQIIVDGKIDISGNAQGTSTQEAIFVSNYPMSGYKGCSETSPPSCPDAISISGNPGTGTTAGAVFYTSSGNSNIKISGNVDFFGAVIASGTVDTNGHSGKIMRDTDLNNLASTLPIDRNLLAAKVASWKEVQGKQ